jgi:cyclic pyranopterin phosphate synthase
LNTVGLGTARTMNVDTLRVSVTAQCNLRCIYCNPLGREEVIGRGEVLTLEEIHRVVRLAAECGITKVRLTGGEPLLREDIVSLVRELAGIRGIDEVAMTTNGILLEQVAQELKAAGLRRVNISLDSARRRCYRQMTGSDLLTPVLKGMTKALEVGLTPVRLNCVVIRDVNVAQIPALAEMSLHLPVSVRFIEYCPTSPYALPASWYVPTSEVRRIIESRFGPLYGTVPADANGPAVYFKVHGAAGFIGFISGRSSAFCHRCNRLRLTGDGQIRPCLFVARSYDLKKFIRSRAGDPAIRALLTQITREKNRYTRFTASAADFSMQSIGG